MVKFKKILAGIMASTLMLSAVGCGMVEKTQEGINKTVVAKVYKQKITLGQVDAELSSFYSQIQQVYGENYKDNADAQSYIKKQRLSVLDTLVNDVIYAKKAEELGIMPTDEELADQANAKLEEIKSSFDSDDEYQQALTASNITEEKFLEELKLSIIAKTVYDDAVKDVEVTDDEIQQYYTNNQTSYTESPNRIDPAHILVSTQEEADAVIERLNNGEDFAEVAKEVSTDSSADNGGDLGWIEYNSTQYDQTFLYAAISLDKGEYTKTPISTQFGYHIIKCLDKEEYPVKSLDEVKEEIRATVLEQNQKSKWTDVLKEWQDAAKIKLYEDRIEKY